MPAKGKLISAGIWVFVLVSLGRLIGFLREISISGKFGVSIHADIAVLLLSIPDIIINILIGGAMAAATIPEFKSVSPRLAFTLFVQISCVTTWVFTALAALLCAFSPYVVKVFAPGFDPAAATQTAELFRWMTWVLPLSALAGVSAAFLQSHNKFIAPALGTIIFNTILVIVLLGFIHTPEDLIMLPFAALAGAALRWIILIFITPDWVEPSKWFHKRVVRKSLLTRYFQALLAGGILLTLPIIGRSFASFDGEGAIAAFHYARKLVDFPLGAALMSITTVIFPKLSEMFLDANKRQEAITTAKHGFLIILIVAGAFTFIIMIFSRELSHILFGWGQLSAAGTEQISVLLTLAVLGLAAQGLSHLVSNLFYANNNMRLPFVIIVGCTAFYVLFCFLFYESIKATGIMVALVATYWIILALQILQLGKKHSIYIFDRPVLLDSVKILAVQILIGLLIFLVIENVSNTPAVQLGIMGVLGCVLLGAGIVVVDHFRKNTLHYFQQFRSKMNIG